MDGYRSTITFGGLLIPETQIIAAQFMKENDWEKVKAVVIEQNLIRKTRIASRKRYFREIRNRLLCAYPWEISEIAGSEADIVQIRLMTLAVVARFSSFFKNFIIDVVRYKVMGGDSRFMEYEYGSFWEKQCSLYPAIANLQESTGRKLEQVTFHMLEEAGYLPSGRSGLIVRPSVPYDLQVRYANAGDKDALLVFLLGDREIAALMRG